MIWEAPFEEDLIRRRETCKDKEGEQSRQRETGPRE